MATSFSSCASGQRSFCLSVAVGFPVYSPATLASTLPPLPVSFAGKLKNVLTRCVAELSVSSDLSAVLD